MLEHTFWDAGVDVNDLADDLARWFRRRGFETQDFSEDRASVVVQARKASWLRTVSGMNLALTVRLMPRREDLQVEIGAGEWTDKAIGGALALFVPWAWPIAFTTGFGLLQQGHLPQEVLDYIETYVDSRQRRTGREGPGTERETPRYRRPRGAGDDEVRLRRRRERDENYWIEQELAELEEFEARLREARGEPAPEPPKLSSRPGGKRPAEVADEWAREIDPDTPARGIPPGGNAACPECNAPLEPDDRFCMECGARLR